MKTNWKIKGESILFEFFKTKKNSNYLLELEELLLSSDEECVLSMFKHVLDLFSEVFSKGLLNSASNIAKNAEYRSWLLSRYEDFVSHLLSYLSHGNADIQIAALQTLFMLVKLEGESPAKDEKENPNFPFTLFKRILMELASDILNQLHLIKVFQGYTQYCDIKLYLLKVIQALFNESSEVSELFLQNCFYLLCSMKFPKKFGDEAAETFAYRLDKQQPFELKEKAFRKSFSAVWNCFLSYELSSEFLRKVIPVFNENILPHLQNPCLMTDFLTNSYNKGGVLSLLALKGLYLLMDKYNLEYPDFFVKLYALLDKDIINGKYSSTFFDLTDLFLSSTHLPSHIVAAFAKKLCRLSLLSHTNNILKILCLVSNLLANHPSLKILIHLPEAQEYVEDPFCLHVVDPAKSNAMNSSLWEIKTLSAHLNPEVCCEAKKILSKYPECHCYLSEKSSTSLNDLYVKLRKRKLVDAPLALLRPIKQKRSS